MPNFGADADVESTSASIELAESKLKHKWSPTLKKDVPKGHPINYKVPNFGVDENVVTTQKNIA